MSEAPPDITVQSLRVGCPRCGRPLRIEYFPASSETSSPFICPYNRCGQISTVRGAVQVTATTVQPADRGQSNDRTRSTAPQGVMYDSRPRTNIEPRSIHFDCDGCGRPVRVYYTETTVDISTSFACPYPDCARTSTINGAMEVAPVIARADR